MNFEQLETDISAIVALTTGLPESDIIWSGRKEASSWRGTGSPGRVCYLRWLAERGNMIEVRRTYDAGTDTRTARLVGHRRLTLEVKFESFSQLPAQSARQLCDKLRTRLRHEPVRQALKDANLGLVEVGPAVNLDRIENNALRSVWVSDVVLCAAENDQPDEPQTGGWIETAGGTLTTGSGTPAEETTEF